MEREVMTYDVVVVGAGPAGLAAAIRLRQLALSQQREISVCIIEKGSEVGAHILSGAVIEPRALDELIPDWRDRNAPLTVPAGADRFLLLTKTLALRLPTPPQMNNHGNYVGSLANLCRWLAEQAEALGVEIYPGFAGAGLIYDERNRVCGVRTGDVGVGRDGTPTASFAPGVELRSAQVILAEGCRGSLTREVVTRYHLADQADPQTYGLGLKEIWEIAPEHHQPGRILHTIGWPLDARTYGGSFLYHLESPQVAIGFVVGLDYRNPHLSPFEEFQRFKTHPHIRPLLEGGRRVAYGARALAEGGLQSLPRLTFPGGLLIGDCAGFLNVPKIKGTHTAMKSGMVAAEAIFEHLGGQAGTPVEARGPTPSPFLSPEVTTYPERLRQSWLWQELWKVRNIRPSFRYGLWPAMAYAALDTYLLAGKAPWTLHHAHADHQTLIKASEAPPIPYPRPDGVVSFDRLSSLALSGVNHEENQPVHLRLRHPRVPIDYNLRHYDAPEQRYCPAAVYEIVDDDQGKPRLQINAGNCVHCKTCDIKDPSQNITWTVPEGGGGPSYPNM